MQFFEVSNKTKENINESYAYIKSTLIKLENDVDFDDIHKNSFFLETKKKLNNNSDCC
jgi:hypothetical protein